MMWVSSLSDVGFYVTRSDGGAGDDDGGEDDGGDDSGDDGDNIGNL